MIKVLVTGAAGFIGGHLYRALKKNKELDVTGVDNFENPSQQFKDANTGVIYYDVHNDLKYINDKRLDEIMLKELIELNELTGEPSDIDKMYNKKYDYIFHLAAKISVDESLENPNSFLYTNLQTTKNVLDYALEHGSKVVFASTSEIYGTAQYEPMDEKHPREPQSPYGLSKLFCDDMCQMYRRLYGLDVKVFRNFNTFGFGQSEKAFIPRAIKCLHTGEELLLNGGGLPRRDFNHVSIVVNTYLSYIESWENMPVIKNCGSGWCPSIRELASIIGCKYKLQGERLGEVNKLIMKDSYDKQHMPSLLLKTIKEYKEWYGRGK